MTARIKLVAWIATGALLSPAQTPKKPSNDGWVEIPQKGAPAPPQSAQPEPVSPAPDANRTADSTAVAVPNTADERPPVLKRGGGGGARGRNLPPSIATGTEIVSDAEGHVVEQTGPAASAPESSDPMIDKARRVVLEFNEKIPDFLCDQVTLREEGEGLRGTKWKKLDKIEAEVMVSEGSESYRNLRRNGKPLKSDSPMESGSWATGDFNTVQVDVLSPASDARFTADGESEVGGRKAKKYKYTVEQPNSHWKLDFNGNRIFPAYRGAIWIDIETGRVLRIEMQSRRLPKDYPLASAEMMLEYAVVPIAGKGFLLPAKSANLACKAESAMCTRNQNEYRNYRKFSSESTLITTDSTITFDGEEPAKQPSKAKPSGGKKKR